VHRDGKGGYEQREAGASALGSTPVQHRPESRHEESIMSVYRVIDVIGTSTNSWEDAAAQALTTASKSVRDLRVAEVVKQDIHLEDGTITYRTKLQLSFKYESES
jgi:dodecin